MGKNGIVTTADYDAREQREENFSLRRSFRRIDAVQSRSSSSWTAGKWKGHPSLDPGSSKLSVLRNSENPELQKKKIDVTGSIDSAILPTYQF